MLDGELGRTKFVVCGDNSQTFRVVEQLVRSFDADVAVVLADRRHNQGPALDRLPGVRIVESERLDEATLVAAGTAQARALALLDGDEADIIHAGLTAQDLNPRIRLVLRMNPRIGSRIHALFTDCVVLSASQVAAPSFVAAALEEPEPNHIELDGSTLYITRRVDAVGRIVCGLADTSATEDDGAVHLFPANPDAADLVLVQADEAHHPLRRYRRGLWRRRVRLLVQARLVMALMVLVGLIAAGYLLLSGALGRGWGEALYETLIDAAGEAQAQPDWSVANKVVQIVISFAGMALLPTIAAVAIDGVLRARLADRSPDPTGMDGHVVVVGLGQVGGRVLAQLHDLGIPVVGVDMNESSRGVAVARSLAVPVVFGDATWWDTLNAASVRRARAVLLLTRNDVTNLEAALLSRTCSDTLRLVLRLFDDDLAERVEHRLDMAVTRSVSRLAASTFAAAMVERRVVGTMSVGRSAVMIAEVPVDEGSMLIGVEVGAIDRPDQARVLAIRSRPEAYLEWEPAPDTVLVTGNRVVIAATRSGLGRLLARSIVPTGAA